MDPGQTTPSANGPGGRFGDLMCEVARSTPDGGDWCTVDKAQALAALVLALRPRVVCEIGVWMGGSMVPTLLAMRALGDAERAAGVTVVPRRAIAIDAWAPEESCVDQSTTDRLWWGAQSHDRAFEAFTTRLVRHGLRALCDVVRKGSDDVDPPDAIDLLHVDGNHGPQAMRDVSRFGACVRVGGILVLDDLDWAGGHVRAAHDLAVRSGFRDLYPLGTGIVLQRVQEP